MSTVTDQATPLAAVSDRRQAIRLEREPTSPVPAHHGMRYLFFILATGALMVGSLTGCTGGSPPLPGTPGAASSSSLATLPATGRPVTMADAASCPVTRPGRFVPPSGVSADALFGAGASHGNGQLWVGGLWPDGVLAANSSFVQADGSVGMKFGWYRVVSGSLTITGRRLDAPAPPARGQAPGGYGDTGFQASGVDFPTEGCWEITGTVGSTTLTFVTFVIKV
jgi:hypothetical protein